MSRPWWPRQDCVTSIVTLADPDPSSVSTVSLLITLTSNDVTSLVTVSELCDVNRHNGRLGPITAALLPSLHFHFWLLWRLVTSRPWWPWQDSVTSVVTMPNTVPSERPWWTLRLWDERNQCSCRYRIINYFADGVSTATSQIGVSLIAPPPPPKVNNVSWPSVAYLFSHQ